MLDEFDKPLEEDDADEGGEDAEVPIVPETADPSPHKHRSEEKTQGSKDYIRPTLDRLRPVWLNTWIVAKSPNFWTAVATVVIAVSTIFYTVYARRQWKEIHDSSADTHDLAAAAKKQADRMQDFADRMKEQTQQTKELADRMKDQSDNTKIIGEQAKIQANAAKAASDTAKKTLEISQRAYLILGVPVDDFPHKRTDIPIINNGHIPAGPTKIVIHEATFRIDDPSATTIPITSVLEKHWRINMYQTIPAVPTGNLISAEVNLPAVVPDDLTTGKQGFIIVAVVTYNDGFPGTPEQEFVFCDSTSYLAATKLFSVRPCEANVALPILTALDKYPSTEYQEK